MFERSISFRDLVIYVIPGVLLSFYVLKILVVLNLIPLESIVFNDSIGNSIIFLFSSTLIGFIQSQIQIKIFRRLLYRKKHPPQIIRNVAFSQELKSNLTSTIKNKFDLNSLTNEQIESNSDVFYLCENFNKSYCGPNAYAYLNRTISVSLFANSIVFPFSVIALYFLLLIKYLPLILCFVLFIGLLIILSVFVFRISKNFRDEWIKGTYRVFYTTCLNNKSLTSSE